MIWEVSNTRYRFEMKNLVVCFKEAPVEGDLIDRIRSAWPEVGIVNVGQKELPEALLEADYFCGHAKVPVDWDRIVRQGRLKWIQSSAAGMDWCLVPPVIESNIEITTASGVLADQVAEHALSLILSWMRRLPVFWKDQYDATSPEYRRFIRKPTRDLTDLTVGIVGFGGVGRRLAEVLRPFRTMLLATDLFPLNKPDSVSQLWPADRLDDLIRSSDVVILSLPLNEGTRGLFDADRFARFKSEALFVNVARGPLVVTEDLVDALDQGRIAGAVLDVTSPEPLPKEHPLWSHFPKALITPHVAGQFHRRFDDVVDIFTANIRRRNAEQPLINRLTPEGKRLGFPIRCPETPLWIDLKDSLRHREDGAFPFHDRDHPSATSPQPKR